MEQTRLKLTKVEIEFHSIIALNESIRAIYDLSLEIRVQALNSLLAIKNIKSQSIGFSAVSFELIHFSREMESYSEKLTQLIFSILHSVTELNKRKKNFFLLKKAQESIHSETKPLELILETREEELKKLNLNIQEKLDELKKAILQTFKFCKNGSYLTICTKIESAHIQENREFFRSLANTVEKSVLNIYHFLEDMNKKLGQLT